MGQTYYFRSESMRKSILVDFAQAAQQGQAIHFPSQQLCRIHVDGESIVLPYDLMGDEPGDFTDFEDVECLGPAEFIGVRYMGLGEIVEEMRELDLPVPACLLNSRKANAYE